MPPRPHDDAPSPLAVPDSDGNLLAGDDPEVIRGIVRRVSETLRRAAEQAAAGLDGDAP